MNAGGYSNSAYWSTAGWSWKLSSGTTEPDYWAAQQDWASWGGWWPPQPFTQTGNHPVVGVTYYEAEAFCNWAGGHLATEAQWEKAARWTATHPNAYPWGDTWDQQKCNNWYDSLYPGYQTAPVGSYGSGVSPYGLHDMAGNVYEWCKDLYGSSYYGQTPPGGWSDPQGPTSGSYRVLRGGSWYDGVDLDAGIGNRCACRLHTDTHTYCGGWINVGFRLAR